MKGAVLGAKYFVLDGNRPHTVLPTCFGSSWSRHWNNGGIAPLARGTPRLSLYQAASTFGSRALIKMPPMPVTRSAGSAGAEGFWAVAIWPLTNPRTKTTATTVALTCAPRNEGGRRRRDTFVTRGGAARCRDVAAPPAGCPCR